MHAKPVITSVRFHNKYYPMLATCKISLYAQHTLWLYNADFVDYRYLCIYYRV